MSDVDEGPVDSSHHHSHQEDQHQQHHQYTYQHQHSHQHQHQHQHTHQHHKHPQHAQYARHAPLDMSAMALALPPFLHLPYSSPTTAHHPQIPLRQQQQPPPHYLLSPPYNALSPPGPQRMPLITNPYNPLDHYPYPGNLAHAPFDPRLAPHHQPFPPYMPPPQHHHPQSPHHHHPNYQQQQQPQPHHYPNYQPPPSPIPSFPRGPPRKPKQSGHALWVGNLPPTATVTTLKDHFARDATADIQSLFLIAKSNCAFVNYRSHDACLAAMSRFHDSRFNGVRLVCRLRRPAPSASSTTITTTTSSSALPSPALATPSSSSSTPSTTPPPPPPPQPSPPPIIVGASPSPPTDRFFIIKSLTTPDLEASVRNGVWATQPHNEAALATAFDQGHRVHLIFSANRSGEYFGYARMASPLADVAVSSPPPPAPPAADRTAAAAAPTAIPTPATATAPAGHIIDDSARGTIFWEADSPPASAPSSSCPSPTTSTTTTTHHETSPSRPFAITWLSTTRLPFHRTRGLRNPWNHHREVKIARDGTELEPEIGRRLVAMFHGISNCDTVGGGGANVAPVTNGPAPS